MTNNRRADAVTLPGQEGPRWLAAALTSSGRAAGAAAGFRGHLFHLGYCKTPMMDKCLYRWGLAGHSAVCAYRWAPSR